MVVLDTRNEDATRICIVFFARNHLGISVLNILFLRRTTAKKRVLQFTIYKVQVGSYMIPVDIMDSKRDLYPKILLCIL